MGYAHRNMLGIEGLTRQDLEYVLKLTQNFEELSLRPIKKAPTLRGKTVINLFLEPSTRTRSSFEIAGKRLSADVINVSGSTSSTTKGETFIDTLKNLDAMNADVMVVRHAASGAAHLAARHVRAAVINAGDGMHEHPTQALLDCATILKRKGHIQDLRVAILGDIAHSRVARSNLLAMQILGAKIHLAAPRTLLPAGIEHMGAHVHNTVEDAVVDADVVMVLRLQKERQKSGLIPNLREYARHFGLNQKRLSLAKPDALLMHPGPMNRGVEIDPDVADGANSVILEQVEQGVAVRMAALYLAAFGCSAEAPLIE